MDWSHAGEFYEEWIMHFCAQCGTKNWVYITHSQRYGKTDEDDGFECRDCGHANIWSPEYVEFNEDPEDTAILKKGRAAPTDPKDIAHDSIRKEIIEFSREMEKQLELNDHKGGWQGEDADFVVSELRDKVSGLIRILKDTTIVMPKYKPEDTEDRRRVVLKAIADQCADIANFAMMVFDNMKNDSLHYDGKSVSGRDMPK